MRLLNYWLCTSVGQKQLVGITGLGLSIFMVIHVSGNLLLFAGPEAYNHYTYTLHQSELLYPGEILLLLAFLVHIGLAIRVTLQNRAARPICPINRTNGEKAARFGSRSMILSGLLLLVFTVLHLITFKWGTYYEATYNGVVMRDLYRLVMEKFSEPLYVGWYLFSLVILGLHLSHGFSAAFQSVGAFGVRNPRLKTAGYVFAVAIAAGFISQPIYFFLTGGK